MDSSVKENILKELTNLEKKCNQIKEIPDILEKFLINVSDTGDIVFKWEQFKPLIKKKIELIASKFNQTYPYNANSISQPNVRPFDFEEIKRNILNGIDSFTNAPFTIQRICELLTDPYRHYKRADKFMKGLEKNVMVISEETVDQLTENGNNTSTSSSCLNSTFTLPSTSDSINQLNGYKEIEPEILLPHNQQTPTIQQQLGRQLDSFTAVFVSSSQIQQNPLERIANLPILESTTNLGLASSSSTASILQVHSIGPLSNSRTILENLDKVSTEQQSQVIYQSVEKQQEHLLETQQEQLISTKTDEIIETSDIKEQIHLFENSATNGQQEKIKTLVQESSKEDKKEEPISNNNESIKEVNRIYNLNDQTTQPIEENEPNKQNETIEQPQIEENVNLETKIEESFKSPNKVNELKRVCDSPDIEPIKRFKSDLDEKEVEITQLNQERTDQKDSNEKSINEENSDSDKQPKENSNNEDEEKKLKNVDKQPELVDNQPKDQQLTNTDLEINKTEEITNRFNEADNLEKSKENEIELLENGNNQQEDTLPANELLSEEKPEEINKELTN